MPEEKKEVDLGGYPDEESKKIAEDLEAEAKAAAQKKPEEGQKGEKPPVKKPEQGKAGEEDEEEKKVREEKEKQEEDERKKEKEEGEGEGKEKKRTPRLMHAYDHEIAKKRWEKEKGELETKINDLSEQLKGKSKPDKSEKIKKFAEKSGLDEDVIKDLIDLLEPEQKRDVSEEVKKKLAALEEERSKTFQDNAFNEEFTSSIIPLLKADEVPEDKIKEVKKILNDLAFTERYAKNDLEEVYLIAKQKGMLDEFIVPKGKKSAEAGKGGARGGEEKDIMELEGEEFEKASDELAKKTSAKTFSEP